MSRHLCILLVLVCPSSALAARTPARTQASTAAAAQATDDQYVGDDTCTTCHTGMDARYHATAHGQKTNPRSPAAQHGCETCHGPGKAHVDAGGDKTKIISFTAARASEAQAVCAQCHNRGEHAFFESSTHARHNVTCVTCHSVHKFLSQTSQLKAKDELQTCAGCHRPETMKILRVMHMPVREGKMTCSNCHNPHGSTNKAMLRVGNSITEMCTSCHGAQRGPFLWEHPVTRDSCTVCHDPHGSSNNRMLVAKPPLLCQRCHVSTRHPSTVYDLNTFRTTSGNRLFGRGCVECHQNIHGSNHPSGTFFLR